MNQTHGRGLLAFLIVAFVSAVPARAADWPVARGASREPVPFRYDPKLWDKVPKAFLEDAPACTLYAGVTHMIEEDGTIETVTHDITRLSSRKALDKLGEYRAITFTPAYEKLTLNEARVLKADGRAMPLREALDLVCLQPAGAILSCLPGVLAYYKPPSPGPGVVLEARRPPTCGPKVWPSRPR